MSREKIKFFAIAIAVVSISSLFGCAQQIKADEANTQTEVVDDSVAAKVNTVSINEVSEEQTSAILDRKAALTEERNAKIQEKKDAAEAAKAEALAKAEEEAVASEIPVATEVTQTPETAKAQPKQPWNVWMDGCTHACMYGCMYVCIHDVCMYMDVCMNV